MLNDKYARWACLLPEFVTRRKEYDCLYARKGEAKSILPKSAALPALLTEYVKCDGSIEVGQRRPAQRRNGPGDMNRRASVLMYNEK